MKRRDFIRQSGLAALSMPLLSQIARGQTAAAKPNIICILSDDVGIGNVHCTGGRFPTPHLDALAQGGTLFTHCYSVALCGPSRAELLTGRYPFRTGMTSNMTGKRLSPAREIMTPRVLKKAGYVTAQVGKWQQMPLQPGDWGFDEYWRFFGSGTYWRSQGDRAQEFVVNGTTKPIPPDRYVPDMMHEWVVDFMTRHKNQPFYLFYSMSHIHGPILRTPDSKPGSDHYADNIAYMDKLVGKLVAELDRLGLRDNTLIVFLGDNGTAGNAQKAPVDGEPLSGSKHTMKEGGSLVPMIVNWKGTTPAGRKCHDLVDFSDFLPTFAAVAGAPLPEGVTIDGRSIAPQIKGARGEPREWIYVELDGWRYVRSERWKLMNNGALFDMKEAPFNEIPVPANSDDTAAIAARRHLQDVLTKLVGTQPPPPGPPPSQEKAQRQRKQGAAGQKPAVRGKRQNAAPLRRKRIRN